VLRKARASMRLVTGEREAAAERREASRTEEEDIEVTGEYLSILPDGRWFEFRKDGGEIIRGRVADHLTMTQLRELNARWTNKRCKAFVHVIRLTRAGSTRERFTLDQVESLQE
jgi:hypothetical protein